MTKRSAVWAPLETTCVDQPMGDYLDYWQLDRPPFRRAAEPYPSPALEEATARVDFLVDNTAVLAALLGEPGAGKTTALHAIANRSRRSGRLAVVIDAFGLSPRELVSHLVTQFGGTSHAGEDLPRLWRRLGDLVAQRSWQPKASLLLIDDAGSANFDTLQAVLRIARIAESASANLTILLAATANQAARWSGEFRQGIELQIEMYGWDDLTTLDYLQHATIDAGRLSPVFTEDALFRIHELSTGVPRQVARLAELALVAGAAAELPLIDTGCVADVHNDLTCPA